MSSPKDKAEQQRSILNWLTSDGLSVEVSKPHTANEFELVVAYPQGKPQGKIMVVRPKDRAVIAVVMQIQMSDGDRDVYNSLPEEKKIHLLRTLRKTAFGGGIVGFGPIVEGNTLKQWTLDLLLYDDGLTQQSLLTGLRSVYSKHLELIEVFGEELGLKSVTTRTPSVPAYN